MSKAVLFAATGVAAAIGSAIMGLYTNKPMDHAPGMDSPLAEPAPA